MDIYEMMQLGVSGRVIIDPRDTPDYPYLIKASEFDEQVKVHEEAMKQGLAWYLSTFTEENDE